MDHRLALLERLFEQDLFGYLASADTATFERTCAVLPLSDRERNLLRRLKPLAVSGRRSDFDAVCHAEQRRLPGVLPLKLAPVPCKGEKLPLERLLRGKRVALVGPAQSIVGTGQGPYIETFDLVVRTNSQWPVPEHLVPDVGARIDGLYHCCNGDVALEPLFDADPRDLRFVCYQANRQARSMQRYCATLRLAALDVSFVYRELAAHLKSAPSTGLVAAEHLTRFPIAELYLTGFDFFSGPYYHGYPGHGAQCGSRLGHNSARHSTRDHLRYFARKIDNDPRIRIDTVLSEILIR